MATFHELQTTKSQSSFDKEMPISALMITSSPEHRKYKEYIGDGCSTNDQVDDPPSTANSDQTTAVQDEDIRVMQEKFNMIDFRAKLRVAEALAQASSMTSPSAKRRLEARKIEMDMGKSVFLNDENEEYTPPKELLIYIMR